MEACTYILLTQKRLRLYSYRCNDGWRIKIKNVYMVRRLKKTIHSIFLYAHAARFCMPSNRNSGRGQPTRRNRTERARGKFAEGSRGHDRDVRNAHTRNGAARSQAGWGLSLSLARTTHTRTHTHTHTHTHTLHNTKTQPIPHRRASSRGTLAVCSL